GGRRLQRVRQRGADRRAAGAGRGPRRPAGREPPAATPDHGPDPAPAPGRGRRRRRRRDARGGHRGGRRGRPARRGRVPHRARARRGRRRSRARAAARRTVAAPAHASGRLLTRPGSGPGLTRDLAWLLTGPTHAGPRRSGAADDLAVGEGEPAVVGGGPRLPALVDPLEFLAGGVTALDGVLGDRRRDHASAPRLAPPLALLRGGEAPGRRGR